jgi:hypothetical protein
MLLSRMHCHICVLEDGIYKGRSIRIKLLLVTSRRCAIEIHMHPAQLRAETNMAQNFKHPAVNLIQTAFFARIFRQPRWVKLVQENEVPHK